MIVGICYVCLVFLLVENKLCIYIYKVTEGRASSTPEGCPHHQPRLAKGKSGAVRAVYSV